MHNPTPEVKISFNWEGMCGHYSALRLTKKALMND